jgi:maltooligosyltrehalose trehalohydrolase
MLFMGEEWGETNPFLYFADHGDDALVEAVRKGRREEFKAFGWGDDVPDPFAAETFERSKLDRGKLARPEHAAIRALYRELLRLRRDEPALRPGGAAYRVTEESFGADGGGLLFTELEPPTGGSWLAVFNLSTTESAEVEVRAAANATARLVLSTDDERFGGDGGVAAAVARGRAPSAERPFFDLPPSTAALFHIEPL